MAEFHKSPEVPGALFKVEHRQNCNITLESSMKPHQFEIPGIHANLGKYSLTGDGDFGYMCLRLTYQSRTGMGVYNDFGR